MTRKHLLHVILVCGMMLLGAKIVSAQQTSMLMYLKIHDDTGGQDSLTFGTNDAATFGVDAALGENSSPPLPPGFSAIFVCPRSPAPADWGIGLLKKDLRDTINALVRKDSFYVSIRNDGTDAATIAANVTLTWPAASWITARCDSAIMVVRNDNVDAGALHINMATQNTFTVSTPYDPNGWNPAAPTFQVRIFRYGSRQPNLEGVKKESNLTPASYALRQNYPNPFNPTTTMKFDIRETGRTEIAVYNMLGQKVSTLVSSDLTPGTYTVQWDGRNAMGASAPSGVYFVRMSVQSQGQQEFSAVRKLMLMK